MPNKIINIRIKTKARFDTRSHRKQKHERYLSDVANLFQATKVTEYDIQGNIIDRQMIEKMSEMKQYRSLDFNAGRLNELQRKVYNKALQLSSGTIPFSYILAVKPYSRANPRPPLPSYIINDHSLDPTTPNWYKGKQFKKSWNIYVRMKSKKEAELVIENNARYSVYIRATERTNSRQMERPIFSHLLNYASKNF
ncbi:MAG: hypothetical protein NZM44_00410 [Candidatus Calescibacterium sp.]|nr:hypothetical protein [Candidatus Calescibacterium sp.]